MLLRSDNEGYCLGRGTCAIMKIFRFKELFRVSQWQNEGDVVFTWHLHSGVKEA